MTRTPSSATPHALLDLIPYELLDPVIAPVVAANIHTVIGIHVQIQKPRPRPEFAFMVARQQFDATKMLTALASESGGAPFKLGLLRHDLGIPILTHVFGESQIGGVSAVISTHRLFDRRSEVIYERTAKIGIHEIGHLFGLNHCWELDCLMHFSREVAQLDKLPLRFCPGCEYELARYLRSRFA